VTTGPTQLPRVWRDSRAAPPRGVWARACAVVNRPGKCHGVITPWVEFPSPTREAEIPRDWAFLQGESHPRSSKPRRQWLDDLEAVEGPRKGTVFLQAWRKLNELHPAEYLTIPTPSAMLSVHGARVPRSAREMGPKSYRRVQRGQPRRACRCAHHSHLVAGRMPASHLPATPLTRPPRQGIPHHE